MADAEIKSVVPSRFIQLHVLLGPLLLRHFSLRVCTENPELLMFALHRL